ncbi:hypothetical protein FHU29_000839 [Hoyosella altamirensis]|uniref:Uncharacterized protein n=1 Tax=Hoyosella altamirensis TaxID=616997 RepID=A0A839RIC8_9ACTN|nr:hypothetical protein [Hoyosella altamirensis]
MWWKRGTRWSVRETDGGLLLLTLYLRDYLGLPIDISDPAIPRLHPTIPVRSGEVSESDAVSACSYWIRRSLRASLGDSNVTEFRESTLWLHQFYALGIEEEAVCEAQGWRQERQHEIMTLLRDESSSSAIHDIADLVPDLRLTLVVLPLSEDWQHRSGEVFFVSHSLRASPGPFRSALTRLVKLRPSDSPDSP